MPNESIRIAVEPKMTDLFEEVRESYGADRCAYPYVPVIPEGYFEGPRILICGKGAGSWGLQFAGIKGIGPWSTLANVPEKDWYPEVLKVQEAFLENGPKKYLSGERGGYAKGKWWLYLYMVMVHVLLGREIGEKWDRGLANPDDAEFVFSKVAFTNLDKVARQKNNLDAPLRRIHDRYYTLAKEIDVLKPCLVWFPTGATYEEHLCKALPGFETEDLDHPGMGRVHGLEALLAPGGVVLRTYHPQYTKGFRVKTVASYLRSHLRRVGRQVE
jgi:hypothetical protein